MRGKTEFSVFWVGLFELVRACEFFAADSVSLELTFVTYQENISFFEIAGRFGVPFVEARHTCLNHFLSDNDDATSRFTRCDCRAYFRCNIEQRFQLRHLLFRQVGKIIRLPKKLFDFMLARSIDVVLSADQDLAVDYTNYHSPIIIIGATLRCFLSDDNSFAIRVVPDDIFEVTEIFHLITLRS